MGYKQCLHTHSVLCDGKDTLEEMVLTAIEKGFDSIGFSGHSFMDIYADFSMSPEKAGQYRAEIARLQKVYGSQKGKYKEAQDIKLQGDRSRLVVLPTTLWFSAPDATGRRVRMERRDFIYAVRDESYRDNINTRGTEKNKWYFIDSNTNINTLRTYFPTLPLNIKTPDTGDRPLQ